MALAAELYQRFFKPLEIGEINETCTYCPRADNPARPFSDIRHCERIAIDSEVGLPGDWRDDCIN
jgi:hypothetical protein